MKDKDWSNYQNNTLNNKVSNLLLKFLKEYKVDNIIDLGCGAGNESVYMVKEGLTVTSIDRQLNKSLLLNRLTEEEQKRISFIESDFINVVLPPSNAITAFFSIPFCDPTNFNDLWNKIYNSLNENGYFVGQLFGNRDSWSETKDVTTFTIEETKELLNNYEILHFEEVEFVRESDNKKWHYYEIIARKK